MTSYTLRPAVVEDCLHRIVNENINRDFAGYLCLQQESASRGRTNDLEFPCTKFFEQYFRVSGGDQKFPYFVPFNTTSDPTIEDLWYYEDVSNLYTPSSLRPGTPFMRVIEIDQDNSSQEWGLVDQHWGATRSKLCDSTRIPVESLAGFLLRDYAFEVEDPSAFTIVQAFAAEFGYQVGGKAFTHLYDTGDSNIGPDSFEKI